MAAIGNHDAVSCEVLNKELTNKKVSDDSEKEWIMPGLSYLKQYTLSDGTIVNLIYMDTNVYEENGPVCDDFTLDTSYSPKKLLQKTRIDYPSDYKVSQLEWIEKIIHYNPDSINILIGHIPYMRIPHKEPKDKKEKKDKEKKEKKETEATSEFKMETEAASEVKMETVAGSEVKMETVAGSEVKKEKEKDKKDKDAKIIPLESYYVKEFSNDINDLVKRLGSGLRIHLYLCADEHNQQLLYDGNLPPIAILGSGGNQLDDKLFKSQEDEAKSLEDKVGKYSSPNHGFLELSITKDNLNLNFHTVDSSFSQTCFNIDRKGVLTSKSC